METIIEAVEDFFFDNTFLAAIMSAGVVITIVYFLTH